MKRLCLRALVILFVWGFIVLGLPQLADAAVQANSNTYGGSAARTRDYTGGQFNTGLHKTWSKSSGGIDEFPPAVHGGVAYLAQDNGFLSATRLTDGVELWRVRIGHAADSPAFSQGHLYVEATPGVGYSTGAVGLLAISAATGHTVWRQGSMSGESSPVVIQGRVCAASRLGMVGCFHPYTGQAIWLHSVGCKVTGALAAAGIQLYYGDYCGVVRRENVYSGHVGWTAPAGGVVYGDVALSAGRVIVPNRGGSILAISQVSGQRLWSTRVGYDVYGSPAVTAGAVYGTWRGSGATGGYIKLRVSDGAVLWRHVAGGNVMSSPVVVGDRVWFSTCGANYSKGTTQAYLVNGMKLSFTFNDGRFTPVVPSGNDLLLIGIGTIYRWEHA